MWDTAAYFSKFLGIFRQCVESDYHESIKRYLSNHVVKRVENLFRKLCEKNIFKKWRFMFMSMVVAMMTMMKIMTNMII